MRMLFRSSFYTILALCLLVMLVGAKKYTRNQDRYLQVREVIKNNQTELIFNVLVMADLLYGANETTNSENLQFTEFILDHYSLEGIDLVVLLGNAVDGS